MPTRNGKLQGHWLISEAITEADTNTTKPVLEIPANTFVTDVICIVTEAFTGGTPSLDIGDGADPDGWIDTVDITEAGTTGAYKGSAYASEYAPSGKYYAAADTIDAVISASLTNGTAYVLAYCVPLNGFV